MLRTLLSLSICPLISVILLYLWFHIGEARKQFDGGELFFLQSLVALFFFLLVWASYRRLVFHGQRKAALATKPVSTQIAIVGTPVSRGPDSLVAEIEVEDVRWRATLISFAHDKAMSGKTGTGLAWLHPKTGAPLAVEFGGKRLSIVPEVVKVIPGSFMEKLVEISRSD